MNSKLLFLSVKKMDGISKMDGFTISKMDVFTMFYRSPFDMPWGALAANCRTQIWDRPTGFGLLPQQQLCVGIAEIRMFPI